MASLAVAAPPQWGGEITLASDHLLRGVSRSTNDPSLSAEMHAQGSQGWFAGAWAATSRVSETYDTSVDLAATLGMGGTWGENWNWRGSYSHYQSPWQRNASWYRYNEFTLDMAFGDALLFSASWSPDTAAYSAYLGTVRRGDAFAYELSLQHTLIGKLRGQTGIGYYDLSSQLGEGYWYGSIGVGWTWQRWHTSVSYVHTSDAAQRFWPETARRGAVASVSYGF